MVKKLLKLTLCIIPCVSLLPLKLTSAVIAPPPGVVLSWNYPEDQLSTNLTFVIYHSTDLSAGASGWTVLTNVVGTNLSVRIPINPGEGTHFFTLTASNSFGESTFATTSF